MALVGTINSPNDFGFKNRIINGGMDIAQRANSATITAAATIAAGYSTVDRFYVYSTGANVTAAQVAGSGATKNRLRITGAASVTAVGIGQRIEANNSYDLAGSTATLSADLAISATLTTVTWTASYANTADTFGTVSSNTNTAIATGTFTVTSTVTNFNTQITIPAAATTGIQILFTVGALTAGLTWTVGNVQLEKGSTATSFDYRPYGQEFLLCQRYCEAIIASGTNPPLWSIQAGASTNARGGYFYKVQKRTSPSFTNLIGTSYISQFASGNFTPSAVNLAASNPNGMLIDSVCTGLTAGQAGFQLEGTLTAGTIICLFTAEL